MKHAILALAVASLSPAVSAGLPTGLSGAWYNPQQSGHGIHLEMLTGDAAAGAWNVYDTAGNPIHLYFEGRVEQGKLVANAYAPRGMKFGSFSRADLSVPRWGSLVLDFTDCDHATLAYSGDGPAGLGFGQGTIALQRLTRIAGTSCEAVGEPDQSLTGVYEGHWEPALDGDDDLEAAVDPTGRLWATTKWTPGPTFVRAGGHPPVIIGEPIDEQFGIGTVTVRYNSAMATSGTPVNGQPVQAALEVDTRSDGRTRISGSTAAKPSPFTSLDVVKVANANPLADDAFSVASLAGRKFRYVEVRQFGESAPEVRFDAAGRICIPENYVSAVCLYEGAIIATEPGLAMFDFELHANDALGGVFHGKGWVRQDTGRLVMVASGGEKGMGLVGVPWD